MPAVVTSGRFWFGVIAGLVALYAFMQWQARRGSS